MDRRDRYQDHDQRRTHRGRRVSGTPNAHSTIGGVDRRIIALGVARMADAVANSFLIVVLPLYIASGRLHGIRLGLSEAAFTGVTLGAFGIVNFIVQPLAGRWSDRVGRRKAFILAGLALLAVVNVAYHWTGSFLGVLAVRIVQAGAVALTIVGTVALVSELSVQERRGRNMGTFNSFRLTGFGIGPLLAGLVMTGGPYHLPFGVTLSAFGVTFFGAGLLATISAGLVWWLVADPADIEPNRERASLRVRSATPGRLLDPVFALGVGTLFMAACIALLSPIETLVNRHLDQGPLLFAVEFAAFIASQAILQPLIGRMTDERGRKKFIVVGLLGLIPTTLLQGIAAAPWQMILARLLQGATAAMVFAPALALAGDLARRGQAGAQLSVLTVAFGLGIALGQFTAGFTVQFGYLIPFAVGAGMAALGALVVHTQVNDRPGGESAAEEEPAERKRPAGGLREAPEPA